MPAFIYFEHQSEGHSAQYAKTILSAAIKDTRIDKVVLICTQIFWHRINASFEDQIEVIFLTENEIRKITTKFLALNGLRLWRMAVKYLDRYMGGICFIPFFDHILIGAALSFRKINGKITGIIFRSPNSFGHKFSMLWRLKVLFKMSLYFLVCLANKPPVFVLDDSRRWRNMIHVRDPAPSRNMFVRLNKAVRKDQRNTYLLFGALTERKGIFKLLEAVTLLPEPIQRTSVFRLVGNVPEKQKQWIKDAIQSAQRSSPELKIETNFNFVTDQTLAAEIINCDVILAPYQNHVGSSGVLYWAAQARRAVIGQNTGLMGYQIQKYNMGIAVDTTNTSKIAKALENPISISEEGRQEFLAGHTEENFAKTILDNLL